MLGRRWEFESMCVSASVQENCSLGWSAVWERRGDPSAPHPPLLPIPAEPSLSGQQVVSEGVQLVETGDAKQPVRDKKRRTRYARHPSTHTTWGGGVGRVGWVRGAHWLRGPLPWIQHCVLLQMMSLKGTDGHFLCTSLEKEQAAVVIRSSLLIHALELINCSALKEFPLPRCWMYFK